MKNLRKYGRAPYGVAVIHGGPGAPGEMGPVARELASEQGVLEPLQTAGTLEGQVEELNYILGAYADLPITLIGYSWGAWLGFIVAARYPSKVRKLILVSSGPFDKKYARVIMESRLDRLDAEEKREVLTLTKSLSDSDSGNMNKKMARFGELIAKADAYDPIQQKDETLAVQYHVFQSVWKDAEGVSIHSDQELWPYTLD